MIVQIRRNIAGVEYWDTEKKKIIFVPKGKQPDFKVEDNPASMITPEGDKKIVVIDRAEGNDKNVVTEVAQTEDGTVSVTDTQVIENNKENSESSELDSMTIKQLRDYAKKNNIDIPSAIKVKGDIITLISDAK